MRREASLRRLGVVMHLCHPGTQEAKAEASLDCIVRLFQKHVEYRKNWCVCL